ncbi:MAG: hypothetical protein C0518_06120 [Opitutus sp.]|nr:hypothetical protein [Opitutus sp.]
MKNSLTLRSVLTLLALSCSLPLVASAADRSALPGGFVLINRVEARVHANGDSIGVGDGRINVQLRLGAPTRILPDGSWLYSHYRAAATDGREFTGSLVVRFENSRVTALVLADRATVTALLEKRLVPSLQQLAANQR